MRGAPLPLLITICLVGCTHLPATKSAPWPWDGFKTADDPKPILFGADLPTLQQSCSDRVEVLRKDAEKAMNARSGRRIATGLASIGSEVAGTVTTALSIDTRNVQSIVGYVLISVGAITKGIDLLVPQNDADAKYAAWRQAFELMRAAEARLTDLITCMSVPADSVCPGLTKPIVVLPSAQLDSAGNGNRERFEGQHGGQVLNIVRTALRQCEVVQVKSVEAK